MPAHSSQCTVHWQEFTHDPSHPGNHLRELSSGIAHFLHVSHSYLFQLCSLSPIIYLYIKSRLQNPVLTIKYMLSAHCCRAPSMITVRMYVCYGLQYVLVKSGLMHKSYTRISSVFFFSFPKSTFLFFKGRITREACAERKRLCTLPAYTSSIPEAV